MLLIVVPIVRDRFVSSIRIVDQHKISLLVVISQNRKPPQLLLREINVENFSMFYSLVGWMGNFARLLKDYSL